MVEAARMSEELRAAIREALAVWSDRITGALVDAQSKGQLPSGVNPYALAAVLVLLATGADALHQIGVTSLGEQNLTDAIDMQIALHIAAARGHD